MSVPLHLIVQSGASGQSCPVEPADSAGVREVAEGIIQADNEGDLARVLGYYAPDATLYPPGEAPVSGRERIRPRYVGLFAEYEPAIVPEIEAIEVCGDLAVVSGRNGGVLRGKDGREDVSLNDLFLMVLGHDGSRWRIERLIWHAGGL